MIRTIAAHQVLSLRRQRVFAAAVGVLAAVTVLAGVLGWSSHRTIIGVYDEAVKLLASRELAAPPNPFLLKPALSMLSNMEIYVTLFGALVAIVIGHLILVDDEISGIGRLVFSRQVGRRSYVVGKMSAAAVVLGLSMIVCTSISVAALLVINHSLRAADLSRLVGFYSLSFLYLMVFALVGMVGVLVTRRRSVALLSALGCWLVITFVLPQFTSGLRPSTALNPVIDPVSTSQTFFRATARARPYSIAEQFKEAAGRILRTAPSEPAAVTARRILPIIAVLLLLVVMTMWLVDRHDFSRSVPGE